MVSRRTDRVGAPGYAWALVGVGLLAVGTVLVLWARTSPGYDPYGWLVWGYQTLQGISNLGGAPSWKPLPFLFTVPYALLRPSRVPAVDGDGGERLRWPARFSPAGSSTGWCAKGRERRWPALAGALFAAGAVLGIVQYFHYILSAQSDPMLVTLVLLAIDLHISGRHRWAFAALWLASLGRPEAWPFIGLYSLWGWRAVPSMRKLIIGGLLLIAVLWFGVPYLTGQLAVQLR